MKSFLVSSQEEYTIIFNWKNATYYGKVLVYHDSKWSNLLHSREKFYNIKPSKIFYSFSLKTCSCWGSMCWYGPTTFNIMTLSIMTLGIMLFSITPFSITTLSIIALSIRDLIGTLRSYNRVALCWVSHFLLSCWISLCRLSRYWLPLCWLQYARCRSDECRGATDTSGEIKTFLPTL
jgi:hypothetical protein